MSHTVGKPTLWYLLKFLYEVQNRFLIFALNAGRVCSLNEYS